MPDRQPFALVCLVAESSRVVGSVSPRVWRAATGGHDGADFWDGSVSLSPTSEAPRGAPGLPAPLGGAADFKGSSPPAGCPALTIVPAPAFLSCTSLAAPRPLSPPRGGGRCLQRCSSSLWCRVLLLELRFSRPCRFVAGVRPACFAGRGTLNTSDPPPQAAFCPAPLPPHRYLSLPRAPCPHTAPCSHIFQPKTQHEPSETLRVPEDPRTGCAMGSHGRSHPKSLGSAWPRGQLWGPLSGHLEPRRDTGTLSQGSAPAGPSRTGWIRVLPSPSEPRCHHHHGTADPEATRERFPMNWHPLRLCQTPVPSAEGGTDPPGPPRPWEGSVKGGRGSSRTQPDIFLSCVGGSDLVWSTFEQEARCHPVPAAWPRGEDQKGGQSLGRAWSCGAAPQASRICAPVPAPYECPGLNAAHGSAWQRLGSAEAQSLRRTLGSPSSTGTGDCRRAHGVVVEAANTSTTAPINVCGRRLCHGASPHLRSVDFTFSSRLCV